MAVEWQSEGWLKLSGCGEAVRWTGPEISRLQNTHANVGGLVHSDWSVQSKRQLNLRGDRNQLDQPKDDVLGVLKALRSHGGHLRRLRSSVHLNVHPAGSGRKNKCTGTKGRLFF